MLTVEHIIASYAKWDMELNVPQAKEVLSRAYPLYGGETEEESLFKCLREDAFEQGCIIKEESKA